MSFKLKVWNHLKVFSNHRTVFGIWSAIRAEFVFLVNRFLSPKYHTRRFDKRYGTNTSGNLSPEEGKLPESLRSMAIHYEPTIEPVINQALSDIPIQYEDFIFVDLGCGKGRTLLLATEFPFSKIIGVELSPITSQIAKENIKIYISQSVSSQKCNNIKVKNQNIMDFEIPNSNLVFFAFNPFVGNVFEECLTRIHHFWTNHPDKTVYFVYCNPTCSKWLENSGLFKMVQEVEVIPAVWSWSVWVPQK